MITTVTGKNQITIPARLARELDIQPGTRIDWSISANGTLVAHILPQRGVLARQIAGMGRAWLDDGDNPVGDLIMERTQEGLEEGLG